ncbi:hypothetical protein NY2A_b396R [Paramecium bursaria Chlorella virus NY2A]|uniref:Uncharacterized protein b396R n=1 Tax=Paramecium bursaria Chlorella virus NY2A TaxID=46021 RepID=A7IWS1_PBCVN|nr:hypothetical protein NY2A_b396R [Paramecium bursaria Chlorella virus NY2A]YP_001498426.1 hypothetical protein AR158_c345R [Paramecium bursaria Chlorella virus AR158]ABT14795.1 hypothetical protein NY2A_b396R [Paramecium bursaria Chlorella virus NY2A]ABU43890.1 hypothetical protein AR158_c345R [Paramecium bursaria Chlorella virus AR158]
MNIPIIIFHEIVHAHLDVIYQRDLRFPSERVNFGRVDEFSESSIGHRRVVNNRAVISDDFSYNFGEF